MLVIGFLAGTALDDADFARPGRAVARAADARASAARRAAVRRRLRHVRPAGGATSPGPGARLPAAAGLRRPRRRRGTTCAAPSPPPPRPTVPCNNDLLAAQLHRRRRAGLADRLRVLRQQRRRASSSATPSTECDFTADQIDALVGGVLRRSPTPADLARVRLQSLCSEYGWSLWGFIQAAASPIDFDFHAWGLERFEKAARRSPRPASRRCWRRSPSVAELPARARVVVVGGGVVGTSVAYHLTRLGLDRRAAARAGPASPAGRRGTRPASSGSCGPPRAAPGWCSTPPSSTRRSRPRPGCPPATERAAA